MDQFFTGEDFFLTARIPTQEGDEVEDGFWHIAFLAVVFDKLQGIGVPLGQFFPGLRVDNEGHVAKFWRLPAQSFIDHELFGCIGYMVIPANDMGNCHIMVIDHDRKIVGRIAILFLDNPVSADVATFKFNVSLDHVRPFVDTGLIDRQTDSRDDACCLPLGDIGSFFILRHAQVFIDIARGLAGGFLTLPLRRQFLLGHIGLIGLAGCQELVNVGLVEFQTL